MSLPPATPASPTFLESWRYAGGTSFQQSAAGGAVDGIGNLVLCGKRNGLPFTIGDDFTTSSSTLTLSADFSAVKLQGGTGEQLWVWEDSSLAGADWMVSAATDSVNDVVLGGFTNSQWDAVNYDLLRDIAAVKLSGTDGTELWRYQTVATTSSSFRGGNYGISYVRGVAMDGQDNPVLVGTTYNRLVDTATPSQWDFFAMKLDGATGDELWRRQGGAPFAREGLRSVKIDSKGDLVAAGYTADGDLNNLGFLVVKLSGVDARTLWTYAPSSAADGGQGVGGNIFHGVDIDHFDNVYVAGGEGAPDFRGKFATTPVVFKLDGATGDEVWAYRGTGGDRIIFNSVAYDPLTDWVVGAGATGGDWVQGASQGGFDFAAVVLDGGSGDELTRWQDGTIGNDVINFAEFDAASGALFFGGFSTAAWTGGAGDEDVIALKFEPLGPAKTTLAPTPAPTLSRTPVPTVTPAPEPTLSPVPPPPTPGPMRDTPAPSAGSRVEAPLASPGPVSSEGGAGGDSGAVLQSWAVGAIATGSGVFLVLLALCLCSVRRSAKAKMAAMAAANEKAQKVLPIPSTKPQQLAFEDIYKDGGDEGDFSSEGINFNSQNGRALS